MFFDIEFPYKGQHNQFSISVMINAKAEIGFKRVATSLIIKVPIVVI